MCRTTGGVHTAELSRRACGKAVREGRVSHQGPLRPRVDSDLKMGAGGTAGQENFEAGRWEVRT